MSDLWVCNASPLIALAGIDRLDVFSALRGEVRVPATVLAEVDAGWAGDRASTRVRQSGRFTLIPDTAVDPRVARWQIDPGEAQVISSALGLSNAGVILDDLAGRRCAQTLGLPTIGTIGLVALAKKTGAIPAAAPLLRAVRDGGLYVSEQRIHEVLHELGEQP